MDTPSATQHVRSRTKQGFDIVIANPPYAQMPKGILPADTFRYSEGKDKGKQNLYKVFVEHAYNLATSQGIFCLITQSTIKQIIEFPKIAPTKEGQVFKSALQGTAILLCVRNTPSPTHCFTLSIHNDRITIKKPIFESIKQQSIIAFYPQRFEIPLIKRGEINILQKVKSDKISLGSLLNGTLQGNINTIHLKKIFADSHTGFFSH
ncbi:Eco57I restriction-modification methylase domain-containing protein [Helicobacter mastomyrinus]|uniref:site-specific DNA-methyltransferase (adenine-specific) n=1 Tax=Helicobacter mastomyrinus TaxID=287948 RepID=A0ABZ3F476_9HELI|nr:Eco57I restriction-modification methylase domain-containing protein [uncultured Helicobacter sp.]